MLDIRDIRDALEVVRREFVATPLIYSEHFSEKTGARVFLKLENLQRTGSFKVRGAAYRLHRARGELGPLGVVAASAGNHAQGVALAASKLGLAATIVMPEGAPLSKQVATRHYGGRVVLHGRTVADALDRARELAAEGRTFIHPYDDEHVVAGQGTVGLELCEQLPAFDEVWVPLGGGGLVSGVAAAVKALRPGVRVVGVQTEACPSAVRALAAGRPVTVEAGRSIADGIVVPRTGELTFELLHRLVDEVITVPETGILLAIVELLERKKLVAEGAGAAAVAALVAADPARVAGRTVAVVVSGGNLDLNVLDRILEQGLMRTGRIARFAAVLDDVPGALGSLLAVLAQQGANVLHIVHDRLSVDLPVGRTRVEVDLETRGPDHAAEAARALREAGFTLEPGRSRAV
ncbi:MAG: threonine ammonia-lyase [Deferrisomatales bacterium]